MEAANELLEPILRAILLHTRPKGLVCETPRTNMFDLQGMMYDLESGVHNCPHAAVIVAFTRCGMCSGPDNLEPDSQMK